MISSKKIERIARYIHESMPKEIRQFSENIENKIRNILQIQLRHLNCITREEFDIQTKILIQTRNKLALLEKSLDELKNRSVLTQESANIENHQNIKEDIQ